MVSDPGGFGQYVDRFRYRVCSSLGFQSFGAGVIWKTWLCEALEGLRWSRGAVDLFDAGRGA